MWHNAAGLPPRHTFIHISRPGESPIVHLGVSEEPADHLRKFAEHERNALQREEKRTELLLDGAVPSPLEYNDLYDAQLYHDFI